MGIAKQNMLETMYSASRHCRVLGWPTSYLILWCLGRHGKTPGELTEELRILLTTISMTLRHPWQMELVWYKTNVSEKDGDHIFQLSYWKGLLLEEGGVWAYSEGVSTLWRPRRRQQRMDEGGGDDTVTMQDQTPRRFYCAELQCLSLLEG